VEARAGSRSDNYWGVYAIGGDVTLLFRGRRRVFLVKKGELLENVGARKKKTYLPNITALGMKDAIESY
jgi:hypothetical protein